MVVVYGYIRVSTEGQVASGLGEEVQRKGITDYFNYKLAPAGHQWGGFFEDPATSGGTPLANREAGARLLARLTPGDHVVFYRLERGFRNMMDALVTVDLWQKQNIFVHFIDLSVDTTTPMGKAIFRMALTFAELEREMISLRTREALARRAASGKARTQGIPLGMKRVGPKGKKRLVEDPKAKALGAKLLELAEGGYSYDAIFWWTLQHRVRKPDGKFFTSPQQVWVWCQHAARWRTAANGNPA